MTSSMYNRLVEGGTPSSTTHVSGDSGVTTTLSSRQLTQSPEYQTITSDPQQLSKAGYFRDHPLLLKGGFGFSKQHSRAWTPRQLSKRELITAIVEIIQRTNQELEVEFGQDLAGYISFFENAPVNIDGKQLKGTARQAFDHLVAAILGAMQRPDKEIHIPPAQLQELFKFRKELKLLVSSVFECTNCGNVLGRCPECMLPYEIDNKNGLRLRCPRCNRSLKEDDQFECECSTMNDIGPLEGHVQLYPQPELLDALKAYFALMEEISWNQLFFVHGYLLRVLDKPRPKFAGIYSLGDLASWEVGARLKSRSPTRSNISILSATKEKCKVNNYHPNRGDCERCRARTISPHLIKMPGELCLPRIMGLPIGQKFDGIHHGYEKADVIYEDTLNGTSVQIGIHLKSRTKSKPNGLGRSMDLIKALYTQLFYSAYLALSGKIELDMIGISVPNTISSEVVESMGMLVQQLGFAFLVVDEDAWLKITDAALEQAAFVQSIQ